MVQDAVRGESEQLPQVELAAAALALRAIIDDPDLSKSHGRDEAPQIWIGIDYGAELVNDASIDEAEVAGIMRKPILAEKIDEPIERLARSVQQPWLVWPRTAHAVDHFIPVLPLADELWNDLRWILQVDVELNRSIAAAVDVVGQDRSLESEIARETDGAHTLIAFGQLHQLFEGGVLAVIVGEQDFEVVAAGEALHHRL